MRIPVENTIEKITPLIIGGQGTYFNSLFHTEFPDRTLSIEYMMEAAFIAQRFKYTHIIPSGGFTQTETLDVSEAASFQNVSQEFGINLGTLKVVKDEVALDSAENLICGLMAVRIAENKQVIHPRPIGRIGFFSQWYFKKRRMTELAKQLGIDKSFYFHGYAGASMAAAGNSALVGEQQQLDQMMAKDDYLLLGKEWETKRRNRYKPGRNKDGKEGNSFESTYSQRKKQLETIFDAVFKKLYLLEQTTNKELTNRVKEQQTMIKGLQQVFRNQVIEGKVNLCI